MRLSAKIPLTSRLPVGKVSSVTRPTQKRFFEVGLFCFYGKNNRLQFFQIAADLFFPYTKSLF